MRLSDQRQDRESYIASQVERSRLKFRFCKISIRDVEKYRQIVGRDAGPILCLGTRNGREIDLFRIVFFGKSVLKKIVGFLEMNQPSFHSLFSPVEALNRSDLSRVNPKAAIGVELNPDANRSDTLIASFDDLPAGWSNKFGLLYSNSFDQSQDPEKTAMAWLRVVKPGGYLIFCFAHDAEPTVSDPVGDLTLDDVQRLFPGELIYYRAGGSRSGYGEAIIKINKE